MSMTMMTYRRSLYYLLAYSSVSAFQPAIFAQRTMSSSLVAAAASSKMEDIMKDLPSPLILGSGSFTRKLILNEMGLDFIVLKRPIDEQGLGNRETDIPHDLVLTLAKAKCAHLVQEIEAGRCDEELMGKTDSNQFLVLTGDQVVTHAGKILEKPESIEQAKSFCARYATAPPSTVGSCVIHHIPSGIQVSGVDSSTIYFRPSIADITDDGQDLVDRLLETNAPILDCAGGLMIEHALVQEHLERIDGTEDSVMGLSKALVEQLLLELKSKLKEANQL
jgi:septum formation protein